MWPPREKGRDDDDGAAWCAAWCAARAGVRSRAWGDWRVWHRDRVQNRPARALNAWHRQGRILEAMCCRSRKKVTQMSSCVFDV
mmetsp:Transcript_36888/g.101798  ORF Transcript_36888/g.101798 Transcript_36888/m.101798 type:complete len:84 (+) Transcript_36888:1419-1670(+)